MGKYRDKFDKLSTVEQYIGNHYAEGFALQVANEFFNTFDDDEIGNMAYPADIMKHIYNIMNDLFYEFDNYIFQDFVKRYREEVFEKAVMATKLVKPKDFNLYNQRF